jgi:UDP-3-O-[3-hydroxymyristoyl] N-acetylglucosamine deacetylase/3-hydroxyacyl-[acyl-carrier-protein] dehydratase
MAVKQKTLAKEFSISGKGLHTSCQVSMTFKPAPVNHGFKFQRVDLVDQPIISAHVDFVVDTARGTVIENQGARISTIEHSLAALTGMDLDNVLIEIDNEEVPILDGSSRYFVEAIEQAGVIEQEADREYFVVTEKMVYKNEKTGSEMILLPDNEFSANVLISFDSTVLNNQFASMNSLSEFKSEIANCRTFVFLHELEFLLKNNLVKGGDVDNAIIIIDRPVVQEELDRLADLFHHERVEVKAQGILNNIDLQFDNECARHKLLDIIGDLALAGRRIKGRIIATKPGHSVNTAFAKMISKAIHKDDCRIKAPSYDANTPTLMDVNKIKSLLPHRYPFLLVDKVIDIQENSLVGIKNVTANEPFFQGHFPDEPVMPGVLLVEGMAQAGGIFVLRNLEGKYSTYFMKIDNVKFRKKVVPGDTIIFKVVLTSPIRRGIAEMRGLCYVGDSIVAEGDYMAQIVKIN